MAYYRWGNWRKAKMLEKHETDKLATPAEVPSVPPSPVADANPEVEVDADAKVEAPAAR
ncbi:hypothetical protein D9M73_276530 [compost metagenome]